MCQVRQKGSPTCRGRHTGSSARRLVARPWQGPGGCLAARANKEAFVCSRRPYGACSAFCECVLNRQRRVERGAFHGDSGTGTAPRCRVHASSFPAFHKSTQVDFCDEFLLPLVSIVRRVARDDHRVISSSHFASLVPWDRERTCGVRWVVVRRRLRPRERTMPSVHKFLKRDNS